MAVIRHHLRSGGESENLKHSGHPLKESGRPSDNCLSGGQSARGIAVEKMEGG